MTDLVLYTTGCPKCRMAERLLNEKGIQYTTVTDTEKITEIAEHKRYAAVPFASLNGEFIDSSELFSWINAQ